MQITGDHGNMDVWTCPACGWKEERKPAETRVAAPKRPHLWVIGGRPVAWFDSGKEALQAMSEAPNPVTIDVVGYEGGIETREIPKKYITIVRADQFKKD